MKFRILEGQSSYIENQLNMLAQKYEIKILGISSTPKDIQLGTGGTIVIFKMEEIQKENKASILKENKPKTQKQTTVLKESKSKSKPKKGK